MRVRVRVVVREREREEGAVVAQAVGQCARPLERASAQPVAREVEAREAGVGAEHGGELDAARGVDARARAAEESERAVAAQRGAQLAQCLLAQLHLRWG